MHNKFSSDDFGIELLPVEPRWYEGLEVGSLMSAISHLGSPLHITDRKQALMNASSLAKALSSIDDRARVCVALKASQQLAFTEALVSCDRLCFDVANEDEYFLCRSLGAEGERVVVTAPFKSRDLLEVAVIDRAMIVVDSVEELEAVSQVAEHCRHEANLLLRVGGFSRVVQKSRFGLPIAQVVEVLTGFSKYSSFLSLRGLQFHLTGYSLRERVVAAHELIDLIERFVEIFESPLLDVGGGVPVSYVEYPEQWFNYLNLCANEVLADRVFFNGALDGQKFLASHYPFFSPLAGEAYVAALLTSTEFFPVRLSDRLKKLGVSFQIEPGRAVFFNAGVTVAQVMGTKTDSSGRSLIGLRMNHTHMRTSSYDYILQPVLVRKDNQTRTSIAKYSAFLVGECCLEHDIIMRRQVTLPQKPDAGDLLIFPHTGGYYSNLYQSPGHRFSLPKWLDSDDLENLGEGIKRCETTSLLRSHD